MSRNYGREQMVSHTPYLRPPRWFYWYIYLKVTDKAVALIVLDVGPILRYRVYDVELHLSFKLLVLTRNNVGRSVLCSFSECAVFNDFSPQCFNVKCLFVHYLATKLQELNDHNLCFLVRYWVPGRRNIRSVYQQHDQSKDCWCVSFQFRLIILDGQLERS